MSWLWVLGAATAEVCGVIGLKLFSAAKGKAHLLLFVSGFSLSFVLLYVSFQFLAVSTAYAVWIGLGTTGAVLVNMLFFHEGRSAGRLVGMMLIIIGAAGIKWLS